MATLAEHYARFEKELKRTDRQREKHAVIEKATHYTTDTARLIILGGILEEHITQTKRLQPKPTEEENDTEFAPVYKFFTQLFQQDFVRQLAKEMFEDRI